MHLAFHTCPVCVLDASHIWAWQLIKSSCSFIMRFCTCMDVSYMHILEVSCMRSSCVRMLPWSWAVPYEEHEYYLFLPLWKYKDLFVTACTLTIDELQWKGEQAITLCFQWCLTFYRTFEAKGSMRNTPAITAVSKFSMKPWRRATTNHHLRDYVERKRAQRRNQKDKGNTMMHAL